MVDQTEPDAPARLPVGVELPGGTFLVYPPSRVCGCADCVLAYEAYEEGKLILPDDRPDDLPW